MSRIWAMPSRHTFTIKPINELIERYMAEYPGVWIDPFAGWNSPAHIQNDLNPDSPAQYHTEAREFTESPPEFDHILFDPPYSPRQISECYKAVGLKAGMKETQSPLLYSTVKNNLAKHQEPGGVVLSFGWNSMGFGLTRGYEILEIMLVPHGGAHNDTIVTVEKKRAGKGDAERTAGKWQLFGYF